MMDYKKVFRAGLIPYWLDEHGQAQMLFMVPTDDQYGGTCPQIAKGKIEEGEDTKQAAIREACEELGLLLNNISGEVVELGNFLGRTTVFVAKVEDKNLFGVPDFETSETRWLTKSQFDIIGRDIHRHVVQAAQRLIEQREKENV